MKEEAMYEKVRVNAKVVQGSTFGYTLNLPNLFTGVKSTRVRT